MGKLYLGSLEVTNYDAVMELSGITTAHTANTEIHVTQALLDRITELENKVLYNGHDYVEIGGVKWATMNVGANSVTDNGLYFAWGEIQGYTADQVTAGTRSFSWQPYKYGNGTSSPGATGMTKYNSSDGKTVLDMSDDAARANWGGSWRMPTTEEYAALGAVCSTAWTTTYEGSASGMLLTVTADTADNGKQLFFPAAGLCDNSSVSNVGSLGGYWSSSLDASNVQYVYLLNFRSDGVGWQNGYRRCYGLTVRPVVG